MRGGDDTAESVSGCSVSLVTDREDQTGRYSLAIGVGFDFEILGARQFAFLLI